MKITLDTNCIIDLEIQRNMTPCVQELVRRFHAGQLCLQIPAIMASEKRVDGTYLTNFDEFKKRIAMLGLESAELLMPLAYFGVTYLDWCIISGPELESREKAIHEILFPDLPFLYKDFCTSIGIIPREGEVHPKWRNPKCDVLSLWCHIHYGGDLFVTTDGNFHKSSKNTALEALGAKKISRQNEVFVDSISSV